MFRKWLIVYLLLGFAFSATAKPRPASFYRTHIEEYIGTTVDIPVGQLTPLNIYDSKYMLFYADTLNAKKKIDGTVLVLIPKRCPGRVVNKTTYRYMVDKFLKLYPFSELSVAIHNSKMKPVTMKGKLVQFKTTIALLIDDIATMQELTPPEPMEDPKATTK